MSSLKTIFDINIIYTPEERRAILYALSEIMLADEIIHQEQEFFDKAYDFIGAKLSDLSTMEHIDNNYAKEISLQTDKLKQQSFTNTLHKMSMADGVSDLREQFILDFYDSGY